MENLVNYSDSESDSEGGSSSSSPPPSLSPVAAKRPRLSSVGGGKNDGDGDDDKSPSSALPSARKLNALVLPTAGTDLRLISNSVVDAQHDGRVRSFPHEEGNWATLVYVPVDVSLVMDTLLEALGDVPVVKTLPLSDLHVSLSRTVSIRHHWIPDFEGRLRKVCDNFPRFSISFSGVDVFVNDDKTRTFLSLIVDCGFDECSKLVSEVDSLFRSFDLPPFYSEQRFHASFAWCLGNQQTRLVNDVLPKMIELFNESSFTAEDDLSIPTDVPEIRMKTGNKLFRFPLFGPAV